MIKILFGFLICLVSIGVSGQTTWVYDRQGNVIDGSQIQMKPGNSVKLLDSLSRNWFILDSDHIFVSCYDKSGNVIWKTDPYKDKSMREYRTKRPVIVNISFGKSTDYYKDRIKDGLKVIWITYNNTQFGFLDIKSGKYYFCGQN